MKIIAVTTKHSTDYFKFDTEEEQKQSAIKIVQFHANIGNYYDIENSASIDSLTKDIENVQKDIRDLQSIQNPNDWIKRKVEELDTLRSRYESKLKEVQFQVMLYKKAMGGDPVAAMQLLKKRRTYGYESFEIEIVK